MEQGRGQTIQKKTISYFTAGKMKLIYYPASVKPDRFVLCSGNYIGEGERVQCGRGYCNLEEAFFIGIRVHVVNFYTNLNFEPDQRNILEKNSVYCAVPCLCFRNAFTFNPFW